MSQHGNNGGISSSVYERVIEQIETFSEALEEARTNPTDEALDRLRDAADELMRATGRILIEVERLRAQKQDD